MSTPRYPVSHPIPWTRSDDDTLDRILEMRVDEPYAVVAWEPCGQTAVRVDADAHWKGVGGGEGRSYE